MNGDSEWVALLYSEMYQPLRRHLFSLLKHVHDSASIDIDECLQDSFVLLWERRMPLSQHPNVKAWLYVTSGYKMKDRIKQMKRRNAHCASEREVIRERSIRACLSCNVENDLLVDVSVMLGSDAYELLLKYYEKSISRDDLARQYGISAGALKMRTSRWVRSARTAIRGGGRRLRNS